MYAVIESNEVILTSPEWEQCNKYCQHRIQRHRESDSWNAFIKPTEHIFVSEPFHATGQFLHTVNSAWLCIENSKMLADAIENEKRYILSRRSTPAGIRNLALERGYVVLRKIQRLLKYEDSRDARRDIWNCNKCAFARVFASFVTEHRDPLIEKMLLKPTAFIYKDRLCAPTPYHAQIIE